MEACKSPPGFGVRLSFLALFFSGPPEHHIARGMAVLPVLLTSFCNSINALGLEYFFGRIYSNLVEFPRRPGLESRVEILVMMVEECGKNIQRRMISRFLVAYR